MVPSRACLMRMRTRHAYNNARMRVNLTFANLSGVNNHSNCGFVIFFNFWRSKQGIRAQRHKITGKRCQQSTTCACSFKSEVRRGYIFSRFGVGCKNHQACAGSLRCHMAAIWFVLR